MVFVQQNVRIWFNVGIYNTINRLEAHFAVSAHDVTQQHDFMKVQTLAAFFHSFHTLVQRTKYSCFLAISPDFLSTSYSPVRLRSVDLILLRKSTCKISLYSTSYRTKDLKNLLISTHSGRILPSIYPTYRGVDKSLARPTFRCIFFMVKIIHLMLVFYIYIYIYTYSNNIPPIVIINRIYKTQNLLSL